MKNLLVWFNLNSAFLSKGCRKGSRYLGKSPQPGFAPFRFNLGGPIAFQAAIMFLWGTGCFCRGFNTQNSI